MSIWHCTCLNEDVIKIAKNRKMLLKLTNLYQNFKRFLEKAPRAHLCSAQYLQTRYDPRQTQKYFELTLMNFWTWPLTLNHCSCSDRWKQLWLNILDQYNHLRLDSLIIMRRPADICALTINKNAEHFSLAALTFQTIL